MQAEACFEAYLKNSAHYKLLAANLQVYTSVSSKNGTAKETIGELDYIVKKHALKAVVHVELACKFYLYDMDAGALETEKWIGPNRKDRLFDKLEKVKLKQFPLLHKNETIEKLKALNIEIPTLQELCLKAFLFLPKEMKTQAIARNYANCVVGYWIKHQDLIKEEADALYAIPSKKKWLLPLANIEAWYSFSEIKKMIDTQVENRKSPLIYKKTSFKTERFFVVWW